MKEICINFFKKLDSTSDSCWKCSHIWEQWTKWFERERTCIAGKWNLCFVLWFAGFGNSVSSGALISLFSLEKDIYLRFRLNNKKIFIKSVWSIILLCLIWLTVRSFQIAMMNNISSYSKRKWIRNPSICLGRN